MLHRYCKLPKSQNLLLFGARQTGKTTLIEKHVRQFQQAWRIDLLDNATLLRYISQPHLLVAEARQKLKDSNGMLEVIAIDEIQKVPAMLDAVQLLMGESQLKFILTGSSARKLKRGGGNLLGGRAIEKHLFPFTFLELQERLTIEEILRFGSIPGIVLNSVTEDRAELLTSYVSTYLKEEVQQEALVRNIPGFVSFLEVAAQQSGELLNYASVARDTMLESRTVQSYYQILEDTLIGLRLLPYRRSVRRRLSTTAKFYLFDIGVVNALERQLRSDPDKNRVGRLFEHFIVLDTYRLLRYLSLDGRLFFWRTKDHQEVDLLIEDRGKLIAALEIKSSDKITKHYLNGLEAFHSEHPGVPRFVVARVPEAFAIDDITVLPWRDYFNRLIEWLR